MIRPLPRRASSARSSSARSSSARPSSARAAAGFTLLEILVALTIVGVVTGFALQSLSGAMGRLAGNRNATVALLLAQSLLARTGQDIAFGQKVSGAAPGGYRWTVSSLPFTAVAVPPQIGVRGFTVHVTIGWRQQGRARHVDLSGLRLAYRRPAP